MAEKDPVVDALSRAEALERTIHGGTVLCMGVPLGVEFGMDLRSYTTGPNFGGMKMIPASDDAVGYIHFMTWGSDLTRCGAFIALHPSDVFVFQWNPQDEMLCRLAAGEEAEQQVGAVRRMEHDATLGPYPLATEEQWRGLSSHLSGRVLDRAGIPLGTAIEAGSVDSAELERELEAARQLQLAQNPSSQQPSLQQPSGEPPPRAGREKSGMATASFVQLDPRRSGCGLSGEALSRFHLDKSEWLAQLLANEYADPRGASGQGGAPQADGVDLRDEAVAEDALVGELQLSYLLFLRLSSLRALEQWKALLHLLLSCEAALHTRSRLYCRVLKTLRAQLALAPADFFQSEVREENFLRDALAELAEHTCSATGAGGSATGLAPQLVEELRLLWAFLDTEFGVDLEELRAALDEDEEDLPVVVHA